MSDIEVINNDKFLIKIQDNINNTTQIINKIITLDQVNYTFTSIANTINSTSDYTFKITSNLICQIFAEEEITLQGYIFNTTTTVTKIIYELSLIQIDENTYFLEDYKCKDCKCKDCKCKDCKCKDCKSVDLFKSTQYDNNNNDNETHTSNNETQFEPILDTIYENDNDNDNDIDIDIDIETVSDYGEFQSGNNFVGIDLHENCNLPYSDSDSDNYYRESHNFNNVIIPEYNPCNSYNLSNPCPPVYTVNENTIYLQQIQGSQVPFYCTLANSWSSELMNELSYRLNLPNAGLHP